MVLGVRGTSMSNEQRNSKMEGQVTVYHSFDEDRNGSSEQIDIHLLAVVLTRPDTPGHLPWYLPLRLFLCFFRSVFCPGYFLLTFLRSPSA